MADAIWFCVVGKLQASNTPPGTIDRLTAAYDKYRAAYPDMDPQRIADKLFRDIEKARGRRALQVATSRQAQSAIMEFAERARDEAIVRAGKKSDADKARIGSEAYTRALMHVLSDDRTGRSRFAGYEPALETYRSRFFALMAKTIQDTQQDWWKPQGARAEIDEIGRALMGDTKVSDTAKELSSGIRKVFDAALQYYRANGIEVGYVKNFLPTMHEASAVQAVSRDEWKAFIKERTDWASKIDKATGEPFEEAAYDAVLDSIYQKIITSGVDKFNAADRGSKNFVARLEQSRFFEWKDYTGWKEYQEKFGNGGNLMGVVAHYINSTSRDLAIIQTLGVDPEASIHMLRNLATSETNRLTQAAIDTIDIRWKHIRGELSTPVEEWKANTETYASTAARMAQLGNAGVASFTDAVMGSSTRSFYGLSRKIGLVEYIENAGAFALANKSSPLAKQFLDNGIGAEVYLSALRGASAGMGDHLGPRFAYRANDAFMKLNGTQALTEAQRAVSVTAALKGFVDYAPGGLDGMPRPLAEAMRAYGITDDLLRKLADPALHTNIRKDKVLSLPAVFDTLSPRDATRVMALVNDIRYASSPQASGNTRAKLHGQAGTLRGAALRSVSMYWSFPIAAFQSHVLRLYYSSAPATTKYGYIAANIAFGTLAGAMLLQARYIGQGKDPEDMTTAGFWLRAAMMSGMIGVTGDMLVRDYGSWESAGALIGPVGSIGGAVLQATSGQLVTGLTTDENVNPGRTGTNLLRQVTPGQNLPVVGALINRGLLDNLQMLVDPDADRAMRAQARNLERRTGQELFWQRGELAPYRAPRINER